MLSNFKLKYKLLVLCALPLLLAMFFALLLIYQSYSKSSNADGISHLMTIAIANSELVHELQIERGLTAGFISSQGASAIKQRLNNQREKVNKMQSRNNVLYKEVVETIEQYGLAGAMNDSQLQLKRLQTLRNEINKQSIDAKDAIGYYSSVNKSLISVIFRIARYADEPALKHNVQAYYYFIQSKEKAGLERAILTNILTKGRIDNASYEAFIRTLTEQNSYLSNFKLLAPKHVLDSFSQFENGRKNRRVASFRKDIQSGNEQDLQAINANDWFAASSERINELAALEKLIAQHIADVANTNKTSAEHDNWLYVILTVLLGSGCVFLAFIVIKNISSGVDNIVSILNYSAENKALDKPLPVIGKDEIATICAAINSLMSTFKNVIAELSSSSEQLASSSEQNSVTVTQTSQALIAQKEQTYQVATAIEEMTVTIQDVANNTSSTANAADGANKLSENSQQVVSASIKQIHQVSNKVTEVHQLISSLNQRSAEMMTVVDVIKAVAEQTNLLALNAAIEAARAGEQGRGFAVVADEVRTLAKRTQDSTLQIEQIISQFIDATDNAFGLIEESQQQANNSVEQANHVASVIDEIQSAILTINQMATQIATATEEQVVVTDEIGQNVTKISVAADESAEAAKQIAQTSNDQAQLAAELRNLSASFKI